MTKLLYWEDSYLQEFEATITRVEQNKIALDQTAFYAEGGGQPTDLGTLTANGKTYEVTRVFKESGEIWHALSSAEGLSVGMAVHGKLDWNRRYALMRHHTAAHLLSDVLMAETGAMVTGNQKYPDRARVDFTLEKVEPEQLKRWEQKANELIAQGIEVKCKFVSVQELEANPKLVKLCKGLPPGLKEVRIVDDGVDAMACGGTHLKNLREIGRIRITGMENKGKGKKRIEFVLESPAP